MIKYCIMAMLILNGLQESFDRTTNERWVGFKVGSYVKFKMVLRIAGKESASREFTNKVTKVTDREVFVFSDEDSTHPREQGFTNVLNSAKARQKGAKSETIKIDNAEYACDVLTEDLGNGFSNTTWWCDKAPGKIVKRVGRTPEGSESVQELVKLSEVVKVGKDKYDCIAIRMKTTGRVAPTVTTWYSTKVPGSIVLRVSEGKNEKGEVVEAREELVELKVAD